MRLLLLLTALPVLVLAGPQPPDLIVHGGKIVTVDEAFTIAQAMAVRDGHVVATGTDSEILALRGDATDVRNLGGKTVLPGLMDSHVHALGAAMYEFDHEVPDMQTIADVLAYYRERAKVVPDGEWIRLQQVFITRLREQRYPTKAELDGVAPKHALYFRTGPDASLNSLALKLSGIDEDFRLPQGHPGKIERDASGEPTGIIRNAHGFIKFVESQRAPTRADKLRRLQELFAAYNQTGITSVAERNTSPEAVELFSELRDTGQLNVRMFLSHAVNAQAPLEDIEALLEKIARHPLHQRDSMLWLRGIKVFLDGGMLTGSAYMREPWGVSEIYSITDPNYRGIRFIPPGKLYSIVRKAMTLGLQPTAHSVGDGAVHALLDAYAEINDEFRVAPHRPCITHCNFMSAGAIEQMAAMGVVADLQPAWLERDAATLTKQFGNERLTWFQPYKSIFESGVKVGGGSDHMQKIGSMRSINPYNPFFGMWIALSRDPRWTDAVTHPEQRLTREQAVRLYTINNAYLMFADEERGSLEPGKLADWIVLDRDILTCPLEQVKDIQVERTRLGGRVVYSRN